MLGGAGITADAHDIVAPDPKGNGQQRAALPALRRAGVDARRRRARQRPRHVDARSATSPRPRWIADLLGEQTVVTATKSMTGHLLGAAGAIEAVATVLAVKHDIVPPTINLDDPDDDAARRRPAQGPRDAGPGRAQRLVRLRRPQRRPAVPEGLTAHDSARCAAAREIDPRDPVLRLEKLFDAGSHRAVAARATTAACVAARGRINGSPATAFCTDATVMGGAMGAAGCRHIVDAIDLAVRERVPVIGLWHSGGARLAEGVEALHAVGLVFQAMIRASGRVPQISVVLGPAAGGAAYGPALTDVVIMSTGGRVFVTGPDVVRSVTGENVDMESLGGPDTHGRRSGVVHVVTDDEDAALAARAVGRVAARPAGDVRPRPARPRRTT